MTSSAARTLPPLKILSRIDCEIPQRVDVGEDAEGRSEEQGYERERETA